MQESRGVGSCFEVEGGGAENNKCAQSASRARSAKSLAAGVQGPLKGPGSSGILDALLVQYKPYFEYFYDNFFHSNSSKAIHHELKSTRWKFWTYRRKN